MVIFVIRIFAVDELVVRELVRNTLLGQLAAKVGQLTQTLTTRLDRNQAVVVNAHEIITAEQFDRVLLSNGQQLLLVDRGLGPSESPISSISRS